MKKKLTITVDADVLPLAKRYAKSKGVSLSSLVEQALREWRVTAEVHTDPLLAQRLSGPIVANGGRVPRPVV